MAAFDPVSAIATIEEPALHIPDGFVSVPVAAVGWVATVAVVAFAVRRVDHQLEERAVPLMGVMAALIFAVQMVNFPVAGGTSGHLIGGALAAVLLGPWAAIIVMTTVVGLQAVLFQDGGLVALGVNVFNVGILSVLVGWITCKAARYLGASVATFAAAWLSVEVAAVATALQLALSDTSAVEVVLPALVVVYAVIGIGEGLITVGALAFVRTARPDLVAQTMRGGR